MPQRTASNHADEKSRAGTAAAIPGGPFLFFSVRGEGVPPRVAILHNVSLCAFVMVLCVQCVRTISHVRWPFVWLAACVYLFLWCGRGACVARRCIQKENIENRLSTRSTHVYACTYNGKRRALSVSGLRLALCSIISLVISEHLLRRFVHLCRRRLPVIERRAAYGRQVQRRRPLDR